MAKQSFGIVGLGVMGENLRPQHRESWIFSGRASTSTARRSTASWPGPRASRRWPREPGPSSSRTLATPRRVLIMVPAGKPVDAVIADLRPHLQAGDVLIDGAIPCFSTPTAASRNCQGTGVLYVGTGVSGGEEGALHGLPSCLAEIPRPGPW